MSSDSPAPAEEEIIRQQESSEEPASQAPSESADGATDASREQASPRPKILVGSRRSDASVQATSTKPRVVGQDQPVSEQAMQAAAGGDAVASSVPIEEVAPIRKEKVAPPTRRDVTSPELEAELDAALGGMSLDQMLTEGTAERASQLLELDSRVRAAVVRIEGDNVFFGLTGRNEGVCSKRVFKEPPAIGDHMDVVLKSYHSDDGLYEVMVPGASIEVSDWSDLTEGAVVEGRITGANTGGLECMVSNIRGFIPASQVALFRVEKFGEFIGQKLLCVITEVNPRKKNLVLSHRALLERERAASRQKLLEELTVGDVKDGVVSNVRDFGAFVDLGGVDGLVHISQLSWDHIKHPSEVLQEGQKVRVKIERVNPQTGKISLSYRDLLDHPWTNIEQRIPVGSQTRGPVTRVAKFGAFVKLAPGVEGLIHISELAHHHTRSVNDVVKEGDEVDVKVLSVDPEAQRIALSLKATLPEPEKPAESEKPDEPVRPATKRRKPLKGGFDHPTGGEQFGLKW